MRYFVKDSFDMPHNEGLKATVIRLSQVLFERNIFGGTGATIFADASDNHTDVVDVGVDVRDPETRRILGLEGWCPACITDEDVLLYCERSGDALYWYKVTYEYSD